MIRRELPYPQENGVVKSLAGFGALSLLPYGRHQSQKHGAWNLNVSSGESETREPTQTRLLKISQASAFTGNRIGEAGSLVGFTLQAG
jgi:hypothetical protein